MSKTIRQTAFSGLLGSKRFVVSVCAAIAMVLGALSVGASIFVPQSAAETQEQAANSPIFTERGSKSSAVPSREHGGLFTSQQILVPNPIGQQTNSVPIAITPPKAKAAVSIEFGPVKASAGISLGDLQVSTEASLAPVIEMPELPATPMEIPAAVSPPEEPSAKQPDATTEPAKEETPPTDATSANSMTPTATPQPDATLMP